MLLFRKPSKIAGAVRLAGALCAGLLVLPSCGQQSDGTIPVPVMPQTLVQPVADSLQVGADRTGEYLPKLADRRVAVVTNHTGRIGTTLLVDSLLVLKVNVVRVFSPEHGFRGDADAGAHVGDSKDARTGLPIVSLYGEKKKPEAAALADVDVVLFDLQDVGVRCFTYVSTLHYVMEACAEQGKPLIVLDRPNPNGFYIDGPVLKMAHTSFVGLHPVPLVHGLTVGEYAGMINGQGWLKNGVRCDLSVVRCVGYDHNSLYTLPVKPSPNLPNMSAVYLYPSLVLFEGTSASMGRGTNKPFQCIGVPGGTLGNHRFTPVPMPGAMDPPHKGVECRGMDLSEYGTFYSRMNKQMNVQWLLAFAAQAPDKQKFFNSFFDKLAGSPDLRGLLLNGADEARIRAAWKPDLDTYRALRTQYLLYADFK